MTLLLALFAQLTVPPLRLQDEGVTQGQVDTLNCVGAGVTCTRAGQRGILTVAGGGTGTPGGVAGNIQVNDGLGAFGAYTGTSCTYAVKSLNASGAAVCTASPTLFYQTVSTTAGGALPQRATLNFTDAGDVVPSCVDNAGVTDCQFNSAVASYNSVAEEGTPLASQQTLNFIGSAVTAVNNPGASRTDVTVVASGTGTCAANQYVNTLNNGAAPTCSQVAYAQVSGTPTLQYQTVQDDGAAQTQRPILNLISGTNATVSCVDNAGATKTDCTIAATGGSGAPTNATYLVQTADATLTNEQAMGALTTGLVKNTTTTGVQSIYAGTSCTNQFPRSLDASGAATCASVAAATDVTGLLPMANGGTNANLTASNGAIPYSTASAFALLAPGTAGQVLLSGGAGAPTWGNGCVTLGTATGATTTVGPVIWTGTYSTVYGFYEIAGYNGGTPIGRVLTGAASISTTALTNGTSAYEGVAGTLTNTLSKPGAPLAVTASNIARGGKVHFFGRSGALKNYEIEGANGAPSVSVARTLYRGVGSFSDLGTNLPLQRMQLTVYDTLAATAASAQTFTTGTTLTVVGCP